MQVAEAPQGKINLRFTFNSLCQWQLTLASMILMLSNLPEALLQVSQTHRFTISVA